MLYDLRWIQIELFHTGASATQPAGWNVSPAAGALHTWRLRYWVTLNMDEHKRQKGDDTYHITDLRTW